MPLCVLVVVYFDIKFSLGERSWNVLGTFWERSLFFVSGATMVSSSILALCVPFRGFRGQFYLWRVRLSARVSMVRAQVNYVHCVVGQHKCPLRVFRSILFMVRAQVNYAHCTCAVRVRVKVGG